MNVYVESNFVLELALRQAQSDSCQTLVDYAADGQIALIVPAYSLAEPYDAVARGGRNGLRSSGMSIMHLVNSSERALIRTR